MIVAGPIIEPGVEEAKAYLRIEGSDEDALAGRLMRSAAELCEQFTGQILIQREFAETLPASSAWQRLRATPVLAITQVEGLGPDGAAFPIPANGYAVDIDAAGDGWVRVLAPGTARRIRATYRAGLAAEWSEVPEALRHGVVRLTAHLYTNRDTASDTAPPAAVTALWRPWRRMRIG
jgi:uncharacterized phiE125 gp8 family phage protein